MSFGRGGCQTLAVRVTLLGAVSAQAHGARLALGGPKQRAVFALLALNANRTVPLDRLVHEIWLDEPPARATLALQAYISRLRRVLADTDQTKATQILTRPPGWVLQIPRRLIDVYVFASHLDDARALLAANKPAEALHLLHAALDLWSGEPLADLDDAAFATEHVTRLTERTRSWLSAYPPESASSTPARSGPVNGSVGCWDLAAREIHWSQ